MKRFIIRKWFMQLWRQASPKVCRVGSTRCRPRGAHGFIPVLTRKPENQGSQWRSFYPKASRLETQEKLVFQLESKDRKKAGVPVQRQSGRKTSLTQGRVSLLVICRPSSGWMRPPTLGRAICFPQFTGLNVNLLPKHPHRRMFDQIFGHPVAQLYVSS